MRFRWRTLLTMAVAVNLIAIATWIDPPPRIIWNASPSVPIGFYRLHQEHDLHVGDLAVIAPPTDIARFLKRRGYLPDGVPLIKPVAALPGQTVCRTGARITVDGAIVGEAQLRDRLGRPLPVWRGCQTIATGALFFMNPARGDSLDGRYFGPLPASSVIGRATPLRTSARIPNSPQQPEES
ncbi:S26 family signal peptidase [Sphingopyxis indica]|uniref:Conjugative transfer signal peptidase TraF n=1 Tax=Sphingopyxis indica TaxID=436663 RepID=A0A239L2D0_9SPHN|nr:S26 family signal peptidase [Sphingopyxis indica]SNT24122.1 conjugative transfer signal peptidase TraF [Sphingopyxis indica]